jgi:hypothetical protein
MKVKDQLRPTQAKVARIRELNDQLRRTFQGGRIVRTSSIAHLPDLEQERIYTALKKFEDFKPENDPNGEHDMVFFDVDGSAYIAKIDYYDVDERLLSDDPSDPKITKRVMTIMRADEY